MLTPAKRTKLHNDLKSYIKKYLNGKITELDESGTRLMINEILTGALGFAPIEEVKTEYMIKGTYADYVVQLKGKRQFLVEVKALSLDLSDKHLRQAVNYGANEGIEWALLTNGREFSLYKILFNKPIEARHVFSVNLEDPAQLKQAVEKMQCLHRDVVASNGLTLLWNKNCALNPYYLAGLLYSPEITNFLRKTLKAKFNSKFEEDEVHHAISQLIEKPISMDQVKPVRKAKAKTTPKKSSGKVAAMEAPPEVEDRDESTRPG